LGYEAHPGLTKIPGTDSYFAASDPSEPTYNRRRCSVGDYEGGLLQKLAARRRVLEIGTGLGVSTRYFARSASFVTTIDPDPWVAAEIAPGLLEQFPNRIEFLSSRSPTKCRLYDLVFVDGDHRRESVLADIDYARGFSPGLVVFHDCHLPGVRRALVERGIRVYMVDTMLCLGLWTPS
jgi:predicted O-methyltransferase YrrM